MAYELSKYKSTALGIVKSGKGCDTGRVTSKNLSRAEARTAQIATIKKVSRAVSRCVKLPGKWASSRQPCIAISRLATIS